MFWFKKKKIKKAEELPMILEKEKELKKIEIKIRKEKSSYQHKSILKRCERFSSGERFQRFK